jgi:hypothetical protein
MREYDASYLESRLLEVQKNYPWLFKTDNVTPFIVLGNDGKYKVQSSHKGKYLLNNRKTANKKLRDLHKGEFSSTINTNEKFSTFEFYSGAAIGADTEWEKAAKSVGIKVKNYTIQDWNSLSDTWKSILDNEYREVVNLLGRKILEAESYSGKLVRRDMMQADKADAIFAIGKIASNGYVDGGTGYASTRGILRGIPVYVFDQTDKQWKVWDTKTNKFTITSEPVLTPHAAVIGTRQLEESGKEAIKSVILNSISADNLKSDKEQITDERTENEVFFEQQSELAR